MAALVGDVRYALRGLGRSPGFAVAVVAMLSLGIGANTVVFSIADAAIWKPLPYADAGRLVSLAEINAQQPGEPFEVSYPNYLDWRERAASFSGLSAWMAGDATLTGEGEPARVSAAFASPDLLDVLGLPPALGRFLQPEENRPGAPGRAVLGYGLWKRKFGSDPSVVGRSVTLDGVSSLVVGIAPASLRLPSGEVDVLVPLGPAIEPMRLRSIHVLSVVGRLRAGVDLQAARQELTNLARRIQQDDPGADPGHGISAVSLKERLAGPARPKLLVLCGAVSFVLLVACANVAGLLLARAASRTRDVAIRTALGASRARLLAQSFTECSVLAGLGALGGLVAAAWGMAPLARLLPAMGQSAPGLDARLLAWTAAAAVLTALLLSLAPLGASRHAPFGALRGEHPSRRSGRPAGRRALTVLQIALTLVLLAGAGLLLESLQRLSAVRPGFRSEGLLTARLSLPESGYRARADVVRFYTELSRQIRALPGVSAASAVSSLPVSGGDGMGQLTVEGQAVPPGAEPEASFRRCLPGYFGTMGIPILAGRDFDEKDGGNPFVVIVSAALARRAWPGGDPIGQRIKVGPVEREPWLTVVGVAGDVHNVELASEPALATYEPYGQRPRWTMDVVARVGGDPATLAPALREIVRAANPDILVEDIQTMDARIRGSLGARRRLAEILGAFAGSGLLLAALGLAGLLSWTVARRTREIGIRIALGAGLSDVLRLVLGEGLRLSGAGIGLGLLGAVATTRLLKSQLFGVEPLHPAALAASAVVLAAASVLAAYVPARRACRVDPALALRSE